MNMNTVESYISKDATILDAESSVVDAVNLMRANAVSSLLVRENGELVGIFTERDLLTKIDYANPAGPAAVKIKDVMTRGLKTVNYNDTYINAIDLMQKYGVRHMPVVKDGAILGVISLRDLLNHYHENLEHLLEETIYALSSAVEKRDPYTAGHQRRVTELATAIANEMNLMEKQVSGISMAGIVHDIGKMYVPSEILNKPGRLSEVEFTLIKVHPLVGYDILKSVEFPWPIAETVYQHHERMNGSGYPRGLKEDQIILEARIIAVADVVEAMASHRPYRPALGVDKALEEITRGRGTIYDPGVVDTCLKVFREKNFAFEFNENSI